MLAALSNSYHNKYTSDCSVNPKHSQTHYYPTYPALQFYPKQIALPQMWSFTPINIIMLRVISMLTSGG